MRRWATSAARDQPRRQAGLRRNDRRKRGGVVRDPNAARSLSRACASATVPVSGARRRKLPKHLRTVPLVDPAPARMTAYRREAAVGAPVDNDARYSTTDILTGFGAMAGARRRQRVRLFMSGFASLPICSTRAFEERPICGQIDHALSSSSLNQIKRRRVRWQKSRPDRSASIMSFSMFATSRNRTNSGPRSSA